MIQRGRARDSFVDWEGYKRIDAEEVRLGVASGKPREKLVNIEDMLAVASGKNVHNR